MRSPARPKPSEKLESMIDPISPIHWTAAKLVLNSFWIAESNTPMLPTLCMWKNVPRQTTKRTRDSSLRKIKPAESKKRSRLYVIEEKMKRKHRSQEQKHQIFFFRNVGKTRASECAVRSVQTFYILGFAELPFLSAFFRKAFFIPTGLKV